MNISTLRRSWWRLCNSVIVLMVNRRTCSLKKGLLYTVYIYTLIYMYFIYSCIMQYDCDFLLCRVSLPFGTAGNALEDQLFLLLISSKLFSVPRQNKIRLVNKGRFYRKGCFKEQGEGHRRRKEALH